MIRGWVIALGAALLGAAVSVPAQTPSAEQIELFKSLSPEDRQALMEQLGIGDMTLGEGSSPPANGARKRDRRTDNQNGENGAEGLFGERVIDETLKPEDSILIDIDFKKDKPPRIEYQGEGLPPLTIPGELAPVLTPLERE